MKTILVDAVHAFVSDTGQINIEMYEMLEGFDNPKIVVTNAPDEVLEKYGLDKVPYPVFSLKKNPLKTDSSYFEILLEQKGLLVEDVVYFEHSEDAVKSAESIGLKSFHFNHIENDIIGVQNFLQANL